MSKQLGNYFWGIRVKQAEKIETIYVYADEIKVQDGDLLLLGHQTHNHIENPPASTLFRVLARERWVDVFAASCLDGSEMSQNSDAL